MTSTANESLTLKVSSRTKTGKSAAFRARLDTKVPGIVYGPKLKSALNISVVPNELYALYKKAGKTGLVTLESDEAKELNGTKVLIKEIQVHPFKNKALHVDLYQLDMNKSLRVTVPLNFVGKAKGVAEGGLLSIVARTVEIKCRPDAIPNHIDVDVSELGLNDSIHVEELAKKYEADGKWEFMYESDIALISCVPPEAEETAAPAAAAAEGAPAAGAAAPAAGAAAAAPAAGAAKAAPAAAAAKAPAKK